MLFGLTIVLRRGRAKRVRIETEGESRRRRQHIVGPILDFFHTPGDAAGA